MKGSKSQNRGSLRSPLAKHNHKDTNLFIAHGQNMTVKCLSDY